MILRTLITAISTSLAILLPMGAMSSYAQSIDAQIIQPIISITRSVVDLKRRRVDVYQGDRLLGSFAVAVGKVGWETPVGTWTVNNKIVNPGWTNFLTGEVKQPGGSNPMGSRWIGFYKDAKGEIGFHGTKDLSSIGKAVSHGCLRMREVDVKKLYELLEVGSIVKVI